VVNEKERRGRERERYKYYEEMASIRKASRESSGEARYEAGKHREREEARQV
jgi:hypothetical protein